MSMKELKKGTVIYTENNQVNTLDIVLKGSIRVSNSYSSITFGNGSILGLIESPGSEYSYRYEALEDTNLYSYAYNSSKDIAKVIKSNPKIANALTAAAIKNVILSWNVTSNFLSEADSFCRFMKENYKTYIELCERFGVPAQSFQALEQLEPFQPENAFPDWIPEYYMAMHKMPPELKKGQFAQAGSISYGTISHSAESIAKLFSLNNEIADYMGDALNAIINESGGNFFDLYSNLMFKASKNPFNDTTPIEAAVSKLIIFLQNTYFTDQEVLTSRVEEYRQHLRDISEMLLEDHEGVEASHKDAYENITGSLKTILDYAEYPEKERETFLEFFNSYKQLSDKNSTDDDARKLRNKISEHFYNIYEAAFMKSLSDPKTPIILKMFFNFGYMDEELAGLSNAAALYKMTENWKPDPKGCVFTMYEWLCRIHTGKDEPSKNEFDLEYPAYLREQRVSGNISTDEEKAFLNDYNHRVSFEIRNMFITTNKMTFGRISTFCPLLSEHNILKPLETICQTPETVHQAIDDLRTIDYSCFYRETIFSDPSVGINSESVHKEVLPYVILTPNVGTRGALWQEISSSRRDTAARMMISIFMMEDISDILPKLAGEFRWELCKRIQGVHWNDISDRSLTSEYCDYVQFYRKNHDLSTDEKEKMKVALQKAKNNFRNVFIMDYVSWIKYEGQGSPRLNKIARGILFAYCPFPKELRDKLAINPLYTDLLERYKVKQSQKVHMADMIIQKVRNTGKPVPETLEQERAFLIM